MKRFFKHLSPSLLFAALLCFSLTSCDFLGDLTSEDGPDSSDGVYLFPVRIEGQWGFINQNGRIIIEPEFDSGQYFSEGLARVRDGGVGYLDANGEWVIQPRFQNGRQFQDGLAAVEIDGRWGFINKSGAFAINPQFNEALSFKEGRAFVLTASFDWEYIDITGEIVRTINTPELDDFENSDWNNYSNGLALVQDFDTDQYGYIDENGDMAINFQYAEARGFYDGLAAIKISDSWGFIDTEGNTVIAPRYIEAGNFGNGLVPVRENTNTWGYADKSGRIVIEPQFDDARMFSEGRAAVLLDGFWGFIDESGNLIGKADYDEVSEFNKGVALVILEKVDPNNENNRLTNYGYMGRDGKLVWYPTR